jgi:hypothetical protein
LNKEKIMVRVHKAGCECHQNEQESRVENPEPLWFGSETFQQAVRDAEREVLRAMDGEPSYTDIPWRF